MSSRNFRDPNCVLATDATVRVAGVNPGNPRHLNRLRKAMRQSRRKLWVFRKNRLEAITQYVGTHYSDDGAQLEVPWNLIELAVGIYTRQLTARMPRAMVRTKHGALSPATDDLRLALDQLAEEIRLDQTLRLTVKDALFGVGILKMGLTSGPMGEVDGYLHDAGQPYADRVDLGDWVHDMSARVYEEVDYAGTRHRLPMETAKELYGKQADKLVLSHEQRADTDGELRTEALSQGEARGDEDESRDYVEVWELWLPKENLLVAMSGDDDVDALQVKEWEGPEQGPFHLMAFCSVPSQVMPLPPVAVWRDMHDLVNNLIRKLADQAKRQKDVTGYRAGAEDDARRARDVSDGNMFRMDDPNAVQRYKSGGIDQGNLAFALQMNDAFSRHAGNLDALGGLSPQADTLGQDKLLTESASQRLADMQDQVTTFTGRVMTDLGQYLWYDPIREWDLLKTVPGVDPSVVSLPTQWGPEQREGDFLQFNVKIEPYSMGPQTPGSRLQTISNVFMTFIAPFAQMMQSQGIAINFEGLMRTIAQYADLTELEDLLIFQDPQMGDEGPVQATRQSPVTNRIHTRINRPGSTRQGKEQAIASLLTGGNLQPSEAAAIGRPTG